MTSTEETDSFEAADADGELTTIIEFTNFRIFRPLSGPEQRRPGSRFYKTVSGESVNLVQGDTYQTVMSEKILHRMR